MTLGTLFAVAGLTLGLSVIVTRTTSVPLRAGPEAKFLLGQFIGGIYQVIIFCCGFVVSAGFPSGSDTSTMPRRPFGQAGGLF